MADRPTLYIGVAAPLVEQAWLWLVPALPPVRIDDRLRQAREKLPAAVGAYQIDKLKDAFIVFCTGTQADPTRVKAAAQDCCGAEPVKSGDIFQPVSPLD